MIADIRTGQRRVLQGWVGWVGYLLVNLVMTNHRDGWAYLLISGWRGVEVLVLTGVMASENLLYHL